MAKNIRSKDATARSTSARKSVSRARPAEKKKVRRAIFKTDQWYENAAISIGIAGRNEEKAAAALKTLHGYGHYHETYRKTEEGWRIQTSKLTRLATTVSRRLGSTGA